MYNLSKLYFYDTNIFNKKKNLLKIIFCETNKDDVTMSNIDYNTY